MKNINTSTFDFPTLIYVDVNCSPRRNVSTVNDVKCERAEGV